MALEFLTSSKMFPLNHIFHPQHLYKAIFNNIWEKLLQPTKSLKLSRIFFFFMLQLVVSFTIFTLLYHIEISTLKNALLEKLQESNSTNQTLLIVLLWTYPFGYKIPLNQCPQRYDTTQCFLTANRRMYSLANAVVIHHWDVCKYRKQLPQKPRPRNQFWIWFNMESPSNSENLHFMDNLINITMSYRLDSDIVTPYGWLEKNDDAISFTIPKKLKLVAWAVSRWDPKSKRVQYYDELQKYLSVDIYGKRHRRLPKNDYLQTISTYKFYLAFENSIHEDYITEKLWINSFVSGTVPVVMGPPRANYELFIPPDSFIHVEDFSSAQELASYLLILDKDDQKYQQYFNWRSNYTLPMAEDFWIPPYCSICKALREAPPHRTIPSIAAWFK